MQMTWGLLLTMQALHSQTSVPAGCNFWWADNWKVTMDTSVFVTMITVKWLWHDSGILTMMQTTLAVMPKPEKTIVKTYVLLVNTCAATVWDYLAYNV